MCGVYQSATARIVYVNLLSLNDFYFVENNKTLEKVCVRARAL